MDNPNPQQKNFIPRMRSKLARRCMLNCRLDTFKILGIRVRVTSLRSLQRNHSLILQQVDQGADLRLQRHNLSIFHRRELIQKNIFSSQLIQRLVVTLPLRRRRRRCFRRHVCVTPFVYGPRQIHTMEGRHKIPNACHRTLDKLLHKWETSTLEANHYTINDTPREKFYTALTKFAPLATVAHNSRPDVGHGSMPNFGTPWWHARPHSKHRSWQMDVSIQSNNLHQSNVGVDHNHVPDPNQCSNPCADTNRPR